jgi:hypothetical protein
MFGKTTHKPKLQQPSADPFRVSDVLPGHIDSLGRDIIEVYAKERDYAIYLASVLAWQNIRERMFVQYSDHDDVHQKQIALIEEYR